MKSAGSAFEGSNPSRPTYKKLLNRAAFFSGSLVSSVQKQVFFLLSRGIFFISKKVIPSQVFLIIKKSVFIRALINDGGHFYQVMIQYL